MGWTFSKSSQFPINGVNDALENEQEAGQNDLLLHDEDRTKQSEQEVKVRHLQNRDGFFVEKTGACSTKRPAPFRKIYDFDVAVFPYAHGYARWKYRPAPHNPVRSKWGKQWIASGKPQCVPSDWEKRICGFVH